MNKNIEIYLSKQRNRADYESVLRVVRNDEIDQLNRIKIEKEQQATDEGKQSEAGSKMTSNNVKR